MKKITNTGLVFMTFVFSLSLADNAWGCGAPVKKSNNSVGLSSALGSVAKSDSREQGIGAAEVQIAIEKQQKELIQLRDAVLKKREAIAATKKN
ncbi:MAG: hypothetical protein RL189_2908 [Pseudomonadota bacterium]|jgi:hypothetical protein